MRSDAIIDILISRAGKTRHRPTRFRCKQRTLRASGPMVKKEIKMRNGLDKDAMKKITKAIKDSGLEGASCTNGQYYPCFRQKIDDLQAVMALAAKKILAMPYSSII